jgi:hypothetical protein
MSVPELNDAPPPPAVRDHLYRRLRPRDARLALALVRSHCLDRRILTSSFQPLQPVKYERERLSILANRDKLRAERLARATDTLLWRALP